MRPASPDTAAALIYRPHPDAVTYDLSSPSSVKIVLPPGSTWSSGLHWHEMHTEYLSVVRGAIRVRLGDEVVVITPSDGEVRVDRGVWHEWSRAADAGLDHPGERAEREGKEAGEDEDVVVMERTDPADGGKHVFFRGLNGVILRATTAGRGQPVGLLGSWRREMWITLGMWTVFAEMDNFPVLVGFGEVLGGWTGWDIGKRRGMQCVLGRLDWVVTHVLLRLAAWVGWLVGLGSWKREYVPREEYGKWLGEKQKGV